jgi:nitroreductase
MCPDAVRVMIERHSLGVRHLTEPAPDDAALALMAEAALHAPDHAELTPFRFSVVRGAARERLATLFGQIADAAGRDPESVAIERERALRAPVTVAVIARIDLGHPLVPQHEQWIAVGGAITNYLNAAHGLGYAGKMLSGRKVRHPAVVEAFCKPGETLVGWIVLGTPTRPTGSRSPKALVPDIATDW